MRPVSSVIAIALGALILAACGSQGVSVPSDDPTHDGAVLFSQRCGGCHTLAVAGTQGSGNRSLRQQGPNFDQRSESVDDVLFAIRNGGFSGPIMPQNIVVGDDAMKVAEFLAKWSGSDVVEAPRPSPAAPAAPVAPDAAAGSAGGGSSAGSAGGGSSAASAGGGSSAASAGGGSSAGANGSGTSPGK